jgi:hypothetical protein
MQHRSVHSFLIGLSGFLGADHNFRFYLVGFDNLEIFRVKQVINNEVVGHVNEVLILVIEIDFQKIVMVLNEDPVVVPN